MVKAWIIENTGSVEELKITNSEIKKPKDNEVLVRQKTIGLNTVDLLQRKGLCKVDLPAIIGREACGVVEEVGPNVEEFKKGDRVAYATAVSGAYTELRNIDHNLLVPVPDYIKDDHVAALLLKGMMAHTLLRRTFFVTRDNTVMINNAASGVGQILCTLAKHYGAKVIATVAGEDEKKVLDTLKIDKIINIERDDIKDSSDSFTKGGGVHAIFDFIGSKTFEQSLDCLSDFGLLVNTTEGYGSGIAFDIGKLFKKAAFITSPSLHVYKKDRAELLLSSNEVFALTQQKVITPNIFKKYQFSEVKEAHRDLESKKMFGQGVILV